MKMKYLALILIALTGCTDSYWDATVGKLGVPATIECYSGGALIYKGKSTGAVRSPDNSDGYQFREKKSGRFMEVSGNCVIAYED